MDFRYAMDTPYPQIDKADDLYDSKLLMPSFAGSAGELTAILTYTYQSAITDRYPDIAEVIERISYVEMQHYQMLGKAIFNLGGYPVVGSRSYWNGSYVNYAINPKTYLAENIKAEQNAILNYEKTVLHLRNEQIKSLIERIVQDEELHLKIFEELLGGL